MAATIISNIRSLVNTRIENKLLRGKELAELPCMENAYLIIEDGIIADYGMMKDIPVDAEDSIDAFGQFVLPCWCDSHTHLVFAA